MIRIHLIGIGALGAGLAVEIAKRAAATEKNIELLLYDFDKVEERNVYSQHFDPKDINKLKAEAIGERIGGYRNVAITIRPWKITADNIPDMKFEGNDVVIDAVDNLVTRHLLWEIGVSQKIPVMHLGMSYQDTGVVSWNFDDYDNFPLSPTKLSPEVMVKVVQQRMSGKIEEETKLPPCDLNASRGLSTNTINSAVDSLFIFLGRDSASILPEELSALREAPGTITTWSTNKTVRNLQILSDQDIKVGVSWMKDTPAAEPQLEAPKDETKTEEPTLVAEIKEEVKA